MYRFSFRAMIFVAGILIAGNNARAQESADCEQLRAYFDGSIRLFSQIGPRLEQLERTPGPAAATEQRQLAKVGLERSTKMQDVAKRAQSLKCRGFGGAPANWNPVLADARRMTAAFAKASKRP